MAQRGLFLQGTCTPLGSLAPSRRATPQSSARACSLPRAVPGTPAGPLAQPATNAHHCQGIVRELRRREAGLRTEMEQIWPLSYAAANIGATRARDDGDLGGVECGHLGWNGHDLLPSRSTCPMTACRATTIPSKRTGSPALGIGCPSGTLVYGVRSLNGPACALPRPEPLRSAGQRPDACTLGCQYRWWFTSALDPSVNETALFAR